jgi:MOSC domain-containing protein YiiM
VPASVVSVHRNDTHTFSKPAVDEIELIEGIGIAGDAHAGTTVRHRSRVAKDPSAPNLRQVHLIHQELFELAAAAGYTVRPGDLGENITTRALDLLALPVGTRLGIGDVVLTVTGLRTPCVQIDRYQPGLLKHLVRREHGVVERLAGVMSIVSRGGTVRAGDAVDVALPPEPHLPLAAV